MNRKNHGTEKITAFAAALLLLALLAGCGGGKTAEEPDAPAPAETPVTQSGPAETPAAQPEETPVPGRQDGERFDAVIILEGSEETVGYEHVRNEDIGFELDYEYDSLERRTEPGRDLFVSPFDDPEDPWNYLELRRVPENSDAAAAAVYAELRNDYDLVVSEKTTLDSAGGCIRIDASGGRSEPGSMQTVYVIPAGDGSLVAASHYTVESAEGFGTRFAYTMNTCAPIDR